MPYIYELEFPNPGEQRDKVEVTDAELNHFTRTKCIEWCTDTPCLKDIGEKEIVAHPMFNVGMDGIKEGIDRIRTTGVNVRGVGRTPIDAIDMLCRAGLADFCNGEYRFYIPWEDDYDSKELLNKLELLVKVIAGNEEGEIPERKNPESTDYTPITTRIVCNNGLFGK